MSGAPGDDATPAVSLLLSRFEQRELVGKGGMGSVHAGVDRTSGRRVAIKVLDRCDDEDRVRFEREAESLRQLAHPGIVELLGHGARPDGTPFLVMEWLEGEDLAARLRRGPLPLPMALRVGLAVSAALGHAHRQGVVHRDVKPSNIFLVGPEGPNSPTVKLIDFGLARSTTPSARPATRTGWLVGTPGYMAPEQARGERDLDARADVFALGSVIFECLSGRPLFHGNHVMAVLAKLLLEEAPALRTEVPRAPAALDALLARMLRKPREGRPADGAEVHAALVALEQGLGSADRSAGPLSTPARSIDAGAPTLLARDSGQATTLTHLGPPPTSVVGPGLSQREQARLFVLLFAGGAAAAAETATDLKPLVVPYQVRAEPLADGAWVFTQVSAAGAVDQAGGAARCALALAAAFPAALLALATGVGRMDGGLPVGQVIDRAAGLLARPPSGSAGGVLVDEVTAALLEPRFEVTRSGERCWLGAERDAEQARRPILGKPGPFVGRATDLGQLLGTYEELLELSRPRVTVIEAVPGAGKSRLLREVWARLAGHPLRPQLWQASAHPLRERSAFAVVSGLLRRLCGLTGNEPRPRARELLLAEVTRAVGPQADRHLAEFLGELLGLEFPDEQSLPLQNARRDPTVMGDQVRQAFADLLAGEAQRGPLVIGIDDLHWADLASLALLTSCLQRLAERPVWLLATSRPGALERQAALAPLQPTLLQLPALSSRAGEQLVRAVLGADLAPDTVARLVTLSDGNPLFLEELIRAAAAGRLESLPETVVAMVQVRLAERPPLERRLLRAGSLFGDTFWDDGVAALLADVPRPELDRALHDLEQAELIHPGPRRRFQGQSEHSFHHALVREAAYAHLTDDDRRVGHAGAGAWLEAAGEQDPLVLAVHFERGAEPGRAIGHYLRAAELALEASDLPAVMERAERALACGALGGALGQLRLLQAEALRWRAEFGLGHRMALEATTDLVAGSPDWYRAAALAAVMASRSGQVEPLVRWTTTIHDTAPGPGTAAQAAQLTALCQAVFQFVLNLRPGADTWHERALTLAASSGVTDPAAITQLESLRWLFGMARPVVDYNRCADHARAASAAAERAGDVRNACSERASLAETLLWAGQLEECLQVLDAVRPEAMRLGLDSVLRYTEVLQLAVVLNLGDVDGLREQLARLAGVPPARRPGERMLSYARSELLLREGRHDEALAMAEAAFDQAADPHADPMLNLMLGRVLVARGELARAEEVSSREALAAGPVGRDVVAALRATVLLGTGRGNEGRAMLQATCRRFQAEVELLLPGQRPGYLQLLARTTVLSLARRWLDEPERAELAPLFD